MDALGGPADSLRNVYCGGTRAGTNISKHHLSACPSGNKRGETKEEAPERGCVGLDLAIIYRYTASIQSWLAGEAMNDEQALGK